MTDRGVEKRENVLWT